MLLASFAVGLILRYVLFIFADHFNLFDKRPQFRCKSAFAARS